MGLDIPLVSIRSTSKGFYGECGRRGGYMEVCGFDPDVKAELASSHPSSCAPISVARSSRAS